MPSTLRRSEVDHPSRRPKAAPRAKFDNGYATIALGALVGLGTLVAELLYRLPPLPSDQLNYLDAARMFPEVPTTFYHTITMRLASFSRFAWR